MPSSTFDKEALWQRQSSASPPPPPPPSCSRTHLVSLDGEPAFPTTPVLSLELGNISKMSKGGREGLSYMWTVFSRCKESIRDGRRLENLSWRLWYEDLKLTGCVSSSSEDVILSDLESEGSTSCGDEDEDEDKLLDDVSSEDELVHENAESKKEEPSSSSSNSPPLIDGSNETLEPNLSRGHPGQQGKKPVVVFTAMEGKGRLEKEEEEFVDEHNQGPASDSAAPTSSTTTTSPPSRRVVAGNSDSRRSSAAAVEQDCITPSTSRTAQTRLPSSPSATTHTSPSKQHLRRSSCPATRDREMLKISRSTSTEQEQGAVVGNSVSSKKEKRALSFANANRPSSQQNHHSHHHHPPPQRLARAMPPLTPETIQDIIGTVLPMNFKSSLRIQLSSPALPSSDTTRANPSSLTKPSSTSHAPSTDVQPTDSKVASMTTTTKEDTLNPLLLPKEQSIKSERSYFTSTTAFSDSGVDTVFSPTQLGDDDDDQQHHHRHIQSPPLPHSSSSEHQSIQITTSAPQQSIAQEDASVTAPRLTQSEETRIVEAPSPDLPSTEEEQQQEEEPPRAKSSHVAPSMQRNSSHHKIAVKPALLSRGKTSSSSTRLQKSALQRTQSAKSVRIIESPTEANGYSLEGKNDDDQTHSATTMTSTTSHTSHTQHPSKSTVKHSHSHIAPKRTLSSSRLKSHHARNASSTNLHRDGRMKSPPPIRETPSPDPPPPTAAAAAAATTTATAAPYVTAVAATVAKTSTATLAPAAAAAERPQERSDVMQAAPHVTKAINIRRNNSSLANLIKTEPRSVSRGFDVPEAEQQRRHSEQQQQISEQGNRSVSSPSSTAIAAADLQSVPDNAPPLHPPPPSPASPVVMIPSSVILPPQPRSSPADPRFRVHSTIRRPPSPPLEEEQDSPCNGDDVRSNNNRPLSPSKSDSDMTGTSRNIRTDNNEKERMKAKTPKRAETMPASSSLTNNNNDNDFGNSTSTAPRDMKPEPQQLTNAKKKQMFFFSSPTTDSDDEGQLGSFKFRAAAPLPVDSIDDVRKDARSAEKKAVNSPDQTREEEKERTTTSTKPAIKVVQVTSPSEDGQKENKANEGLHQHHSEGEDDDEYEDEDDSDEWSSEASESEEDEQQAAIRREEERQRLMFAKRTPSMVATQGGLLSKMLRPEEYNHGSANMPAHLRNNASAMHLNQLPNVGSTAGIERARAPNTLFTVTGLLASKSTAALPDLKAAQNSSKLVPTKSGNHLTRLGGAPSGVELESDDDDDEDGDNKAMQEISPTQQKKLNALMQRTTSYQGKAARNTSPPRHQQEAPLTQVTRVTSAAQIAMQPPEPTNIFTPRTTRRNMLSTELTESLRASLLAERNRNRPGLERIVSAFGNRFGAGNKQQQQAQQAAQATQAQQQPDFAPLQTRAQSPPLPPPHPTISSAPLQPPRIQRGSTGFSPVVSKQDGNAADRLRPDARAGNGRLPPNTRANSDPPQQTEYYSPGFHHTGW